MESTPEWRVNFERESEQAEAAVEQMAKWTSMYYKGLIEDGIPKPTAGLLTAAWIQAQFTTNRGKQ